MIELDQLITELEGRHGIAAGSTLIVPNIETALGVVRAIEIAAASPRIKAMLVATEDMVADLGAGRSRAGTELYYPRSRFLLECAAAGVLAIDSPYTFADAQGAEADMQFARSIGYQAKGVWSTRRTWRSPIATSPPLTRTPNWRAGRWRRSRRRPRAATCVPKSMAWWWKCPATCRRCACWSVTSSCRRARRYAAELCGCARARAVASVMAGGRHNSPISELLIASSICAWLICGESRM
ncbi:HpcH/HpaI aldolase/citrate lyase family protein [Pseudomonas qingdaonensis]|nr:HpcH/HpaI aldolase/citrate lyase family protein [Pseudomonas qingdaonensis]